MFERVRAALDAMVIVQRCHSEDLRAHIVGDAVKNFPTQMHYWRDRSKAWNRRAWLAAWRALWKPDYTLALGTVYVLHGPEALVTMIDGEVPRRHGSGPLGSEEKG